MKLFAVPRSTALIALLVLQSFIFEGYINVFIIRRSGTLATLMIFILPLIKYLYFLKLT